MRKRAEYPAKLTMILTIRLYKRHDLDLLEIKNRDGFEMEKQIKKVLAAYASGQSYNIKLPEKTIVKNLPADCRIQIKLSQKDQKIIDFVKEIRPGVRNSAIKMIFRSYLPCINIRPYFISEDANCLIKKNVEDQPQVRPEKKVTTIKETTTKKDETSKKEQKNEIINIEQKTVIENDITEDNFDIFAAVNKMIDG